MPVFSAALRDRVRKPANSDFAEFGAVPFYSQVRSGSTLMPNSREFPGRNCDYCRRKGLYELFLTFPLNGPIGKNLGKRFTPKRVQSAQRTENHNPSFSVD